MLLIRIAKIFVSIFASLLMVISFSSLADKKNLPIPRFVSIKFNEVNARTGPAVDCPIEWVFIKKNEPVEIIAKYNEWRKIRDIKGGGGWVRVSGLSKNRSIVIVAKNNIPLLDAPGKYDAILAKLTPNLRCSFVRCKNDWCLILCKNYKGWVPKKHLWGVYPEE